jgi:archaellum component FlaG (FlaF/FlaG flagellin family)
MASEAEIERLYQLFVANGGGNLTFSGTNLTPKQYSEAFNTSQLTPLEMAQLEARQHQFNRQKALNSIANEIDANNFSNPYLARGSYGSALLSALGSSSGVTSTTNGIAGLTNAFSGFSDADKALIFAGVLSQTDIDLEKFLKIAGLTALGLGMYNSLTNHTNTQTANIPQTMQDADALASMNEQFGEQGDPCSSFNQLMGILAGIFDGTLDFIDGAIGDITSLLNDSGITSLIQSIIAAITGAGSVVADVISAIVGVGIQALGAIVGLVAKVINAIADVTTQIANEINALADMAAELLRKALALILGSAAIDPCKKKVLENTGSPAMKEAVEELNAPLGTRHPDSIEVTTDTRADEDEVKRMLQIARNQAELNPGVSQTPFTDDEDPKDYRKDEVIEQAGTTIESSEIEDDDKKTRHLHTRLYWAYNSGDYEHYLTNKGSRIIDRKRAKLRAMTDKAQEVIEEGILAGDTKYIPSENIIVDNYLDGNRYVQWKPETAKIYNEAKSYWTPKQKEYIQSAGSLASDIRTLLNTGSFQNKKDIEIGLKGFLEELINDSRTVNTLLTVNYKRNFQYTTEDGKVDPVIEEKLAENWNSTGNSVASRKYDLATKNLQEIKSYWLSVKDKVFPK